MPINLNVVTAGKLEEFGEQMWDATKTYARKGVPIVQQSGSATIQPNTLNVWSFVNDDITITKGTDVPDISNEYIIRITYSSGSISFSWGVPIIWHGGSAPVFTAGKIYEISILEGLALFAEFG